MKALKRHKLSIGQHIGRIGLGLFFIFAGVAHLTFARRAFQAQVPNWVPISKDQTVLWSGYVEILIGLMLLWRGHRNPIWGKVVASFLTLVFPGNWTQFRLQRNAFGLNTYKARFVRLIFQPLLIWLAVWSTNGKQLDKNNLLDHQSI